MSAVEDDTPVTLPGRFRPEAESPSNIPEVIPFETTGEIVGAVLAANHSEDLMGAFVQKAVEAFAANSNGGNGGNDAGEKTLKEIKRHKWLAALMSLLLGSGGMVGSYYALKARAETNTQEVQVLKEATKAAEPRIEQNTAEIRLIKVNVSNINKSVGQIATGVESLQQVNVKRLEKENEKLEREIRRLERNR